MLHRLLPAFMASRQPSYHQALASLRLVFASMFGAQLTLALLVGGVVRLWLGGAGGSALMSQVLVALALPYPPLALLLAQRSSERGGKTAAIAAALLTAVLLSAPAWLLAFGLAIGSGTGYLLALAAILGAYYALGFLMCNRFARAALRPEPLQGAAQSD